MHNSSCPHPFSSKRPIYLSDHHGGKSTKEEAVMFLLHAFTFLSFLLIVLHLLSFLLTKLFTFLLQRAATSIGDSQLISQDEIKFIIHDSYSDDGGLAAGVFSREEDFVCLYNESFANDTLLVEEEKDSNQQHLLEVDESFVTESSYASPLDNDHEKLGVDRTEPSAFAPPTICVPEKDEDIYGDQSFRSNEEEVVEEFSKDEERFIIDQAHPDSKKFQLEEDKEAFGGSLTGESTSKSSMEWRSSTILRDSETECPYSSSSRRSSSRWETHTLFRRYDEEMTFFDRLSAQKLAETESFRSINFQPRSISQRIVHKFTTQKKKGGRDPYQELESAYVAQICLAWEALNWNYNNLLQKNANGDSECSFCTPRIAQQFQQFQVLLQRFIENEPYVRGRRPEVFSQTRISSPKLLQVPEIQAAEADEGKEAKISSTEFLAILQYAIRTFMDFLKADKENPCQVLKAFIKRRSGLVDPNLLHSLKRANKKEKMWLKDLLKRRRCLKKKRLNEEEMAILMGLIDMKVVSRILRMPQISQDQLHWCEEKMTKTRIWNGKIQRDSSTLFSLFTDSNVSAV